jgi:REP element-mobilizing transposase RayT
MPPGSAPSACEAQRRQIKFLREFSRHQTTVLTMHYQRRLPHIGLLNQPVFITWRLAGSLPPGRHFPAGELASGAAFAAMDRLLDEARTGPSHLRMPALASIVAEAICYNSARMRHFEVHHFVVMPNHVHLLATPLVEMEDMVRSLKGITARRANAVMPCPGRAFWQHESYDRVVRSAEEFRNIKRYIERNPVRAGLIAEAAAWPWLG